jgi:hypothetical protein
MGSNPPEESLSARLSGRHAWSIRGIRVQEPAALPIPVTGPGSGSAFTNGTHAKRRHRCASLNSLLNSLLIDVLQRFHYYCGD